MADTPEQTTFSKLRKRMFNKNPNDRIEHQIPSFWAPVILILGILIFVGMYYNDKALPTPLLLKDEANNPGRFIAERAENYLRPLENLGPKLVGSVENDVLAVEYLLRELTNIKQLNLDNAYHFLEIDHQVATGGLILVSYGSLYQGIHNIIVKLSPKKLASTHSVLVNCHFDSVATSPGAADDGLNCAVMLEIIRVLASSETLLKHNVIFLFNGAEENGLQGAHAFITQHKWRKEIKALINLEAAGNGGKEIMFQASPKNPWLLQHYARVAPHPKAQAMAEEIFQFGLIPSDTDFRVFRDFGGVVGADFAHAENGYVYHTKYDSMRFIELGTYQHTGDNILEYVKALATADEIFKQEATADTTAMVFFDFCGWFLISYTKTVGIIINVILSAFTLLTLGLCYRSMKIFNDVTTKDICKEFGWSFLAQLLGWILAIAFVVVIGVVVDAAGRPLSWYSSTWLLSGLYYLPVFLGLATPTVVLIVHKKSVLPLSHRVQMLCHANCIILIVIIIVLTGLGVRSAYIPLLLLILYETSTIINLLTGLQNKVNYWLYVHLAGQIIPLMFIITIALLLNNIMVPISGRSGPMANPEIIIAAITALMGIFSGGFIMPLVGLMRSPRLVLGGMTSLIILFFIFIATPIGFPYGAEDNRPTPQRLVAFHTYRTLRNEDGGIRHQESGVYVASSDRNLFKYIKEEVPALDKGFSPVEWCEEEFMCGLSHGQYMAAFSYWIPFGKPDIIYSEPSVRLELVATLGVDAHTRRYHFKLTGPDNMDIYLSPYQNASLVGWSFFDTVTKSRPLWKERTNYYVSYTYSATDHNPLLFYIDIKVPDNWTGPRVDISISGSYRHHVDKETTEFKRFLKSFPDWTVITSYMSTSDGWTY